jgi:hypothetical protein
MHEDICEDELCAFERKDVSRPVAPNVFQKWFSVFCVVEVLFSCFCLRFLSKCLAILPFASASLKFRPICWV